MSKVSKFYVEIYTYCPNTLERGWEIELLELDAVNENEARLLATNHPLFDCIITS